MTRLATPSSGLSDWAREVLRCSVSGLETSTAGTSLASTGEEESKDAGGNAVARTVKNLMGIPPGARTVEIALPA